MFWKNIDTPFGNKNNTIIYGEPKQISKKLIEKYKKLSSIIYVTVPFTGNKKFDNSLEIFSKMSHFKNIQIESEISKVVLKSIIENKKNRLQKAWNFRFKKNFRITKIYNYKNKSKIKKLDYKYEIF